MSRWFITEQQKMMLSPRLSYCKTSNKGISFRNLEGRVLGSPGMKRGRDAKVKTKKEGSQGQRKPSNVETKLQRPKIDSKKVTGKHYKPRTVKCRPGSSTFHSPSPEFSPPFTERLFSKASNMQPHKRCGWADGTRFTSSVQQGRNASIAQLDGIYCNTLSV